MISVGQENDMGKKEDRLGQKDSFYINNLNRYEKAISILKKNDLIVKKSFKIVIRTNPARIGRQTFPPSEKLPWVLGSESIIDSLSNIYPDFDYLKNLYKDGLLKRDSPSIVVCESGVVCFITYTRKRLRGRTIYADCMIEYNPSVNKEVRIDLGYEYIIHKIKPNWTYEMSMLSFDRNGKEGTETILSPKQKIKIINQYSKGKIITSKVECMDTASNDCEILSKYFKGTLAGLETEWIPLINSEGTSNSDLKIEYKISRDFYDTTALFELRITPRMTNLVCSKYDLMAEDGSRFIHLSGTGIYPIRGTGYYTIRLKLSTCEEASKLKITTINRTNNEERDCGNKLGTNSPFVQSEVKQKDQYVITENDSKILKRILSVIIN